MSVIATDNFNRADSGSLGANWTQQTGEGTMKIQTNAVNNTGDSSDEACNYSAATWPNDQYSQCTVSDASTYSSRDGPGVGLRMSTSANTYYRIVVTASSNIVALDKVVTGTATNIGTRSITFSSGQVLYGEIQGTTFILKYNGAALGATLSDSAISSGRAGLGYSSEGTGQTAVWDDFEGGDFASAGLPPGLGPAQEMEVFTQSFLSAMMR